MVVCRSSLANTTRDAWMLNIGKLYLLHIDCFPTDMSAPPPPHGFPPSLMDHSIYKMVSVLSVLCALHYWRPRTHTIVRHNWYRSLHKQVTLWMNVHVHTHTHTHTAPLGKKRFHVPLRKKLSSYSLKSESSTVSLIKVFTHRAIELIIIRGHCQN